MGWSLLLASLLAAEGQVPLAGPRTLEPELNRARLDFPLLTGPTTGQKPASSSTTPKLLRPNQRPVVVAPPSQVASPGVPTTPGQPNTATNEGPILEPPLSGPTTLATPTPSGTPTGVKLDPPDINDIPLLDDYSNLDALEDTVPALEGTQTPAKPKAAATPPRTGTLNLEIEPDELAEQENRRSTNFDSATDQPGRGSVAEFDENIRNSERPPLDFGTKRKGPLSRLRNEPRSVVPPPRDRASENNADVDLAFRRQVDRAVRAAGAPHIKSQEVLVQDRKVWIRLKVDRFWNKRSLRKSVESLPILAGYDVRLDVE